MIPFLGVAVIAAAAELPRADCTVINEAGGCFTQAGAFASVDEKGLRLLKDEPRYWRDRDGALGSIVILRLQAEAFSRTKDRTIPISGRLDRRTLLLRYDVLKARYDRAQPYLHASELDSDLATRLAAFRAALLAIKVHEAQYFAPLGKIEIGGNTLYEPSRYVDQRGSYYPEQILASDVTLAAARDLASMEEGLLPLLAEAERTMRRQQSECRYGFWRRLRLPDRDSVYDRAAPALSVCLESADITIGHAPRVRLEVVNWLDRPITIREDAFRDPTVLARNSYEHDGLGLTLEAPNGDWLGRDLLGDKAALPEPTFKVTIDSDSYRDIPRSGFVLLKGLEPRCSGVYRLRPHFEDCSLRVEGGACYNQGGRLEVELEASGPMPAGKTCPRPPDAGPTFGAVLEEWLAGAAG